LIDQVEQNEFEKNYLKRKKMRFVFEKKIFQKPFVNVHCTCCCMGAN